LCLILEAYLDSPRGSEYPDIFPVGRQLLELFTIEFQRVVVEGDELAFQPFVGRQLNPVALVRLGGVGWNGCGELCAIARDTANISITAIVSARRIHNGLYPMHDESCSGTVPLGITVATSDLFVITGSSGDALQGSREQERPIAWSHDMS